MTGDDTTTSATSEPKTLYLIDGHAQFFRAYYAIRSGMTSPVTQEPTNLTYGFVGMLLKLLREYGPDYLAVTIDVSGDRESFRSELYPEYKANRESAPDDFGPQVERCLSLLEEMHVPVIGMEGVEADDVIASLVDRLMDEDPDLRIRIVSRDKDLTQVLRPGVELFDVHTDQSVSPADVFKTEGVEPRHVVDILALMGDNVDNVPGVPGIGPKTAAKLILEYGSTEALLENIDQIKGKRRENIEASGDQISLAKQLVELRRDLPVAFELPDAAIDPKTLPVPELLSTFRQLGFTSHGDTLQALAGIKPPGGDEAPTTGTRGRRVRVAEAEPDLFSGLDGGDEAPAPESNGDYRGIFTAAELDEVVAAVRAAGECAVDTETDRLSPRSAKLCGVSIATAVGAGVYIPVRSPDPSSHLDLETVIEALRPVLEDESITKIGQNIKYDMIVLRGHGLELRGPLFDTMVASYVIDATRSSHGLDVLALAILGIETTPLRALLGSGAKAKTFDQVPLPEAIDYAAEDADLTLRLREAFKPTLEREGLMKLMDEVEMPLVPVLAELEFNGIRVDPDELARQREGLGERIEALRRAIVEAAPHPFNPDSPRQLAVALFNDPEQDPPGLGLRVLKRGKTGPSTDQEVLEKIATDPEVQTPVPRLILEYRQLTKLVNTYLVALAEEINPETKRVHASFHQTVATTGRLSSSDPNLQNIPIRTEVGREIRRAFVAEDGASLLTADYSQIELRMLAHLSKDEALTDAFEAGEDIHRRVASEVFDVSPERVTAAQRGTAKMVNFGIVYGITPYGLARRLGGDMSVTEAKEIIDAYKVRFPGIDHFLAECIEMAERQGYVETILGRRRLIPQIQARHPQQRALGERLAINTVVQGSAADLIKVAMIDLHRRLPMVFPAATPKMLLQIHDELVFEVEDTLTDEARAFVIERMEDAMPLAVPLVVDTAVSTSWIDAK